MLRGEIVPLATAPTRLDLGGAPSDVRALRADSDGFVLNAAIDLATEIEVISHARHEFSIEWPAFHAVLVGQDSHSLHSHPRFELARDVCTYFPKVTGHALMVRARAPIGSGLATSTSFVSALAQALRICARSPLLTAGQLIRHTRAIESGYFAEEEGGQDQIAITYGGFNATAFHRDGSFSRQRLDLPPGIVRELRGGLELLQATCERSSASAIRFTIDAYSRRRTSTVSAMSRLPVVAARLAESLAAGDMKRFWLDMRAIAALESQLSGPRVPAGMQSQLSSLVQDLPDAFGRVPGAGGGGCILVCRPPRDRAEISKRAAALGLRRLPLRFTDAGAGPAE
jgi:D-glycero-alpha-D-manno-heptose-7-phosphate kinase